MGKRQPKAKPVTTIEEMVSTRIVLDKAEMRRSEESLVERIASPEEMSEIIAKYGPPKMPLKDRRSVIHFNKKGKPA